MAKKISVDQIEGNATQEKDGLMSSDDKEKLDGIESLTTEDIDAILRT